VLRALIACPQFSLSVAMLGASNKARLIAALTTKGTGSGTPSPGIDLWDAAVSSFLSAAGVSLPGTDVGSAAERL
jgi:hypothetical protein